MATREVSNSEDILDSRDIIARIEELQEERQDLENALEAAKEEAEESGNDNFGTIPAAQKALDEWDASDDGAELIALQKLQDEAEGYSEDWRHGSTLIRDSYFQNYAQELAEDIGAMPKEHQWPTYCIDWDYAARELQMDYTQVDFDGVAYWIR